jgi:putative transposase
MSRIARIIAAGIPHHLTQRGNRRLTTFFENKDYQAYIDLMAEWCQKCGVEIWAYCFMPNHVHLIAVPKSEDGREGTFMTKQTYRMKYLRNNNG